MFVKREIPRYTGNIYVIGFQCVVYYLCHIGVNTNGGYIAQIGIFVNEIVYLSVNFITLSSESVHLMW